MYKLTLTVKDESRRLLEMWEEELTAMLGLPSIQTLAHDGTLVFEITEANDD